MTKQAGNLWLREVKSTNEPVHSGITALQENAQETLFDPADGLVLSFRFRFGAGVHLGHGLLQGLPSDPAYFGIKFQPEADCLVVTRCRF